MSKIRLGIVAVLISVFGVSAVPGQAHNQWKNYHWARYTNPLSVQVADSMTEEWDDHLVGAASDWSLSSILELNLVPGETDLLARYLCEPAPGKIRACNAPHPDATWLGSATVWADDNGHIQKATVQMNDSWFATPIYDNKARRHVLCQQLGRTLGLDYQYTQPSCMDNKNGLSNGYDRPGPHDYVQLEAIYAHSHGGSSQDPPDPPPPPKKCKHKKHDKPKKCNRGRGRGGDGLVTTVRTWEEDGLTVTQYALRVQ